MKKNLSTIIIITLTLILAGIAVFTAIRLYQLRQRPVAPTAPESKPKAQAVDNRCSADIMLLLDRTGSMSWESNGKTKFTWAKEAITALLSAVDATSKQGNFRMGLASFAFDGATSTRVNLPLADVSSSTQAVRDALSGVVNLQPGDPQTCIDCALNVANREVTPKKIAGVKQYIIMLSDGRANRSQVLPYEGEGTPPHDSWKISNPFVEPQLTAFRTAANNLASAGKSQGLSYYVLGYGPGTITEMLTTISSDPDSTYYHYQPEPSLWAQELLDMINEICVVVPTPTPTIPATTTPTPTTTATSSASPSALTCPALTFSLGSATPTPTPTPTPSGTPNECNGTCGSNTNCQSAYYCYQGFCRNPSCPTEIDCTCNLASCNNSCSQNSDCTSGLVCSSSSCRNPSCTGETDCTCPTATTTAAPTTAGEPTLPNAGVGTPTILGIGGGLFLLILSLALAL